MFYKDFQRDVRALGSWVLFLLVFARASIDWFRPFVDQMIIAGVFIFVFSYIFSFDGYVARSFAVAVFTSLFYEDLFFSLFILVVTLAIWFSSLKFSSKKEVLLGVLFGGVVTALGFFIPSFY
ncbi:MAG: hypothetical protein ACMXX7_01565 [Candidatus Woesearchaeota archaeon]